MELVGKHITLGVTGGIAAYKSAELVRLLMREGASVQVVMTEAATHFITPLTFQALSGRAVFVGQWDAQTVMPHIALSRESDLLLIAPASADFMAKLAHGLADDLLSTLALARNCPLMLAPAMNKEMWLNPATQRNIATLRADGLALVGPASGDQACGEVGLGRMCEPAEIVSELIAHFSPKVLQGKKVLLTAGPTVEAIDPVRGITNLSSGKMGFALALAAQRAGAEVTLVCGPVSLATPLGSRIRRINVISALDMHAAVMQEVRSHEIFIAVAAVADYRPKNAAIQKIKKDGKSQPPIIELVENPDILAEVAALPRPPFCVGFAAESHNLAEYAERKRAAKKIPLIVGNLISDGFGGEENTISLFDARGETKLPTGTKTALARALIEHIATCLPST